MFNWACLMNHAYKKNPPQPHVHWHFIPRYKVPVKFIEEIYEDLEFSNHYSLEKKKIVSRETQEQIVKAISENL